MEKLDKMINFKMLPHKYLFYLGFFTVMIFLGLSYWQFNRYQTNQTVNYDDSNQINVNINEINDLPEKTYIRVEGTFTLVDYYKLRSRVHNGNSGYHVIAIYKNQDSIYLSVNHGWIPLENNLFKIGNFRYVFDGFLINFDSKSPVGQDDVFNSDYLFRIDKSFIENDQNISLINKYILLRTDCGTRIECIELNTGYKPPHLSYSIQWLFFAVCLSIVILRKNKII